MILLHLYYIANLSFSKQRAINVVRIICETYHFPLFLEEGVRGR
jgi:hypothetical protein